MNESEFRKIVEQAINELLFHEHFENVASRNWIDSQGNEEELYPYLAEMIRCRLKTCAIQGIGWGKYPNRIEKSDCLCIFNSQNKKIIYSVELKGPSKDDSWVSKGFEEDCSKLKNLTEEGIIDYGVSVGLWLKDNNKCIEKYPRIIEINSSQVGVKVVIRDTQQSV